MIERLLRLWCRWRHRAAPVLEVRDGTGTWRCVVCGRVRGTSPPARS